MPTSSDRPRCFPTWRSASTRRRIPPGATIAISWIRSASIAPCWCNRASTAPTTRRCWRRSRRQDRACARSRWSIRRYRPSEIEALHHAGVRGLRSNLVDRHDARNIVPSEMLNALATRIAPLGWHLELLVNLDEASAFAPSLGALAVPVVLGHMGYPRGGARGWLKDPAFAELQAVAGDRALLDQAHRSLPHLGDRASLPGCRRGRADADRDRAGADAVGHRLAARHDEEEDGERRRSVRPARTLGTGCAHARKASWSTTRRRSTASRRRRKIGG